MPGRTACRAAVGVSVPFSVISLFATLLVIMPLENNSVALFSTVCLAVDTLLRACCVDT